MTEINYKSSFDFILPLVDIRGTEIGVPEFDFEVVMHTIGTYEYKASCISGVFTNCFDDGGQLHIVCDNHSFPPGILHIEFKSLLPDDVCASGIHTEISHISPQIRLVNASRSAPCEHQIQAMLPVLKGDKGEAMTWDSMSDFDKQALVDEISDRINVESSSSMTQDDVDEMIDEIFNDQD